MSNEISALVGNSLETYLSQELSLRDSSNSAKPTIDKENTEKSPIASIAEKKLSLDYQVEKSNELSETLTSMQGRKLTFETSNDSGDYVIKVIDKDTNEIIRQIPSEEFIRVAEKIKDFSEQLNSVQGLLYDSKI